MDARSRERMTDLCPGGARAVIEAPRECQRVPGIGIGSDRRERSNVVVPGVGDWITVCAEPAPIKSIDLPVRFTASMNLPGPIKIVSPVLAAAVPAP